MFRPAFKGYTLRTLRVKPKIGILVNIINALLDFSVHVLCTCHGLKRLLIERLRVGDFVLSQPENTGEQAYRRINDTFVFEDKSIFEVVYQGEHGRSESLLATPNHPFWVKGVGWTGAEYLEAGHVLELSDGRSARVASVRDTEEKQRVYNFEVDGFHTYYVGNLGVWVHNANCPRQIDWGQQGKHIPGFKNYDLGRSLLTADPDDRLEELGNGQPVNGVTPGDPGYKERIDFGYVIGKYRDSLTGTSQYTTKAIVHYSNRGVHLVPARP